MKIYVLLLITLFALPPSTASAMLTSLDTNEQSIELVLETKHDDTSRKHKTTEDIDDCKTKNALVYREPQKENILPDTSNGSPKRKLKRPLPQPKGFRIDPPEEQILSKDLHLQSGILFKQAMLEFESICDDSNCTYFLSNLPKKVVWLTGAEDQRELTFLKLVLSEAIKEIWRASGRIVNDNGEEIYHKLKALHFAFYYAIHFPGLKEYFMKAVDNDEGAKHSRFEVARNNILYLLIVNPDPEDFILAAKNALTCLVNIPKTLKKTPKRTLPKKFSIDRKNDGMAEFLLINNRSSYKYFKENVLERVNLLKSVGDGGHLIFLANLLPLMINKTSKLALLKLKEDDVVFLDTEPDLYFKIYAIRAVFNFSHGDEDLRKLFFSMTKGSVSLSKLDWIHNGFIDLLFENLAKSANLQKAVNILVQSTYDRPLAPLSQKVEAPPIQQKPHSTSKKQKLINIRGLPR